MKTLRCSLGAAAAAAAAALLAGAAAAQTSVTASSPTAVQAVLSGQLTTANAAWWGFDPTNATTALQAAINSGATTVIVPNMGQPWNVDPIVLASNQDIEISSGVVIQARRGGFLGTGDCLFTVKDRSNITINGYGAVLRMWKQDYLSAPYPAGEWRHCFSILSGTNIQVAGLTCASSGGDGFYIGRSSTGTAYSQNITLKDVVSDNNYRQGMSVISVNGLTLQGIVLQNTSGAPPSAGIDFEPNTTDEVLLGVAMKDFTIQNNDGCGMAFYLSNMAAGKTTVQFLGDSGLVTNNRYCAIRVDSGQTLGSVVVQNTKIVGSTSTSLTPGFTVSLSTGAAAPAPTTAFAPTGCTASSLSWQSSAFSSQSAPFTAAFDAVPGAAKMDGITGLCLGSAAGFTSLAAAVRFNNSGLIDARNGGSYAAAAAIPYAAGAKYHFRMAVDPAAHRYSVWVTPPGAAELALASNYAFRAEQAATPSLDHWAIYADAGSHQVCGFTLGAAPAPAPDTTPPAVALTAPAPGATVSGSTAVSGTASDNVGVAGVQFKLDGINLGSEVLQTPYATVWNTATTANGSHSVTAVARDAAGNTTTSAAVSVTVSNAAPAPSGACATASLSWQNKFFAAQSAAFSAGFDAVPAKAKMDGVTGLSLGIPTAFSSLAVTVRFNSSGFIDARNGGAYAAAASVPYTAGAKYHFRLAIDPAAHRYSVWVTPPGAAEIALASNYAFRTEQAATSRLDHWGYFADSGSHQVCSTSP